jgi:membrane associated rhomboid family serine protease
VLPLRDDLERPRFPALALVVASAAAVAGLAALVTGAGLGTTLLLLADALAIWVFGASVEARLGRVWFVLLALFGGAGVAALALAADQDARLVPAAATGIALELVATHLIRFRGARVTGLVPVPLFAGLAQPPAWVVGAGWGALALGLVALGALGGGG